jgi:hypothetical protein
LITAALAIMLAQTCAGVLPKPGIEVEWLRNGKAWARDVPVEATTLTRTYRRTSSTGAKSMRTLSCTNGTGGVVLTESINSERQVRLPVSLKTGESRIVDGVPVRRIRPPANAASNAYWFAVSADAARIYGVREGLGIVEMRMQSMTGGVDIFRAFARQPTPVPVPIVASSPEMEAELARLQMENRALQDSVAWLTEELRRLRAGDDHETPSPVRPLADDRIISFAAVDTLVTRGQWAQAIALLQQTRRQIEEYRRLTGQQHPASAHVATKLGEVVAACLRVNPRDPARPGAPSVCDVH